MANIIEPDRLKQLRKLKGLSQEQLAGKTRPRLTKQTIYRLERRHQQNIRKGTIQALSAALEVEPEVLSGEKPIQIADSETVNVADDARFQINIRVDGAVRNAFTLAARRYNVPLARIVELAPILFVLVAEESLDRRSAKLKALGAALDRISEMRSQFPHLPASIAPDFVANEAIDVEQNSIANRDIFGRDIPEDDHTLWRFGAIKPDYDEYCDNPFAEHLRELSEKHPSVVSTDSFSPYDANYSACIDDALKLAGGNRDIANGILRGLVLVHEIPHELLLAGATAERVAWLRPKIEAEQHRLNEALNELLGITPDETGDAS